jgi:histidinol phosphatase-like PHP family hydrolase
MEIIFFDSLGWVGAFLLLLAYALVSFKRLPADSMVYQGMNVVASILLAVNTLYHRAYPSSFVNIVWTFIAIFAILTVVRKHGKSAD